MALLLVPLNGLRAEWHAAVSDFTPISDPAFVAFYAETDAPDYSDHRLAVRTDRHGESRSAAEVTFRGISGRYRLTLHTIGEEDGESTYTVLVNQTSLGTNINPPTTQKRLRTTLLFGMFELKPGDIIRVVFAGASNRRIPEGEGFAYARGRWRGLELILDK